MKETIPQEAQELLNRLRSKGYSDKQLAQLAYLLFKDQEISFTELKGLLKALNYEMPESLAKLSEEELRKKIIIEGVYEA